MSNGWIKLHRSMFDNDLWLAEPFTKAQAWIDLIGNANHKAASVWIRGIEVRVDRGQIAWSELTMSKRWTWSRNKVRRYLRMLKDRGMVEQQTNKVTSIVTICNYGVYQSSETTEGTANETTGETTEGQQKDNRRYTNKNDKNDNNEKNGSTSTAVAVSNTDAVNEVFDYWKHRMGKNGRTVLSDKRRKAIQGRMKKEGRTVEEIKQAIDGCASSPFHMGQGPDSDGTVYDDLELICRNNEKLEQFIQIWEKRDRIEINGHKSKGPVDLGDTSW